MTMTGPPLPRAPCPSTGSDGPQKGRPTAEFPPPREDVQVAASTYPRGGLVDNSLTGCWVERGGAQGSARVRDARPAGPLSVAVAPPMAAAGTSARPVYAPRTCVLGLIAPWDSPQGRRALAGRPAWKPRSGDPSGIVPAGAVGGAPGQHEGVRWRSCRCRASGACHMSGARGVEISTVSAAEPEPDFWILNLLCYSVQYIFTGEQRRHGGDNSNMERILWQKRT